MSARAEARWLDAPPAGWETLLREDPNSGPTHRPELSLAFAAALPGFAPAFVAIESGGELIGGAPVTIERRAALHWIHALPYALTGAPLARAGRHEPVDRAVAEALADRAAALGAVGGEWVLYRPVGPAVERAAVERIPGETRTMTTAVLDLSGGPGPALRGTAKSVRESLASPAARGLVCAEEPRALEETYALYATQARAWPGHRARPLELLRRLIDGPAPAARLFTVRDDGGLLSGALALVGDREWMLWWSGSHPDGRRRHAFTVLVWWIAMRAAESGAVRFNLGASAGRGSVEAFKKDLGAILHPVPIRWMAAGHAGAVGRAVAALQARLRAGRSRGEPG